jgi:RHS repeat-associated protein
MRYDDSTGIAKQVSATLGGPLSNDCSSAASPVIRCTDYKYDQFLNLAKQSKQFSQPGNLVASASEVYQYDEVQRLLGESRSYVNVTPNSSLAETYTYDDIGNILSKSDFGNPYTYGNTTTHPSGAGPHAVLSVWDPVANAFRANYTYDANGNMRSDGNRNIDFDDQDRPVTITLGGVTTIFRYTPDGDRYLQRTTTSTGTSRTVYYVDKLYERTDWDQKPSEERTYIGASVVVKQQDSGPPPQDTGSRQVRYLHLDRLGSTDTVTDETGNEVLTDAHGFDAFGGPRGRDWQPSGNQLHPGGEFGTTTARGFTGHGHLDETFLIHMNGRVYDYRLGRFLSVDPIISNPASSQSINPYSYIGNNPLSGVDPTGYSECNQSSFSTCSTYRYHTEDKNPKKELPAQFEIKVISEADNGKTVYQGTVTPNTPIQDVLNPGAVGRTDSAAGANADGNGASGAVAPPFGGYDWRSAALRSFVEQVESPSADPFGELAAARSSKSDWGVQAWLGVGDLLVFGGAGLAGRLLAGAVEVGVGVVRSAGGVISGLAEKLGSEAGSLRIAAKTEEEGIRIFHGSVSNYSSILKNGLDPGLTPTWVTTSRAAAENAIGPGRLLSPGQGLDRGIVESLVPRPNYEALIRSGGISPTRSWPGFGGGGPFPENVLRSREAIDVFNRGIVQP